MDVHRDGPPVLVFINTKAGLKVSWLDEILSSLPGVCLLPKAALVRDVFSGLLR